LLVLVEVLQKVWLLDWCYSHCSRGNENAVGVDCQLSKWRIFSVFHFFLAFMDGGLDW
jgi:hypothetical protein